LIFDSHLSSGRINIHEQFFFRLSFLKARAICTCYLSHLSVSFFLFSRMEMTLMNSCKCYLSFLFVSLVLFSFEFNKKNQPRKTSKFILLFFSDENVWVMTTNIKPLSIVAKCALCSIKTELFVCSHCDEVICQKCLDSHQVKYQEILKEQWINCEKKFQNLSRPSG